jgi:hypothetical protein
MGTNLHVICLPQRRARATKLEHVANQGRQPKDMRSAESDVPRKQPQAAPTGRGGDALQFDDDGSDGMRVGPEICDFVVCPHPSPFPV